VAFSEPSDEMIKLPRSFVRMPIELVPPPGFDPERLETWPHVDGRLEWVGGRLLYMPPCGDRQQDTAIDVATCLGNWVRTHPEFRVGGNEAGMKLGGDVRAAEAAVWRRQDAGPYTGQVRRTAPLLAVEVSGEDEDENALRTKAHWYLDAGVQCVWLVLTDTREVVVATRERETRHATGETLPLRPELPDLAPRVDDLFRQISAA
jgi:Uma2 family endonuclease